MMRLSPLVSRAAAAAAAAAASPASAAGASAACASVCLPAVRRVRFASSSSPSSSPAEGTSSSSPTAAGPASSSSPSTPVASSSSSSSSSGDSSSSSSTSAPAASTSAPSNSTSNPPPPSRAKAASASSSSSKPAPPPPFPVVPLQFDEASLATFPSLLTHPHPILDAGVVSDVRDPRSGVLRSRLLFFNDTPIFEDFGKKVDGLLPPSAGGGEGGGGGGNNMEAESLKALANLVPLSQQEIANLHRHVLLVRRVVTMRTKGKLASMYALVVAGNGRGLVGFGEGKDDNAGKAARKAFNEAVKNLGYVKRWEGRTLEGEASGKWSATEVVLRPRPTGFGLRVPPVIHAIARSAGISDLSASIRGSSNPLNVVKATIGLLCGGTAAPPGLGDGLGGSLRRGDRGRGMRERDQISRARGRRIEEVLR
ncbi:28S ribosomal protein S5, mitochondrial [Tilletia horrida]|uniref:Small ribosomal subunit protein uS5m n=1 Tax=Tilletia horrida TaxID=155126 RepID=A0AAN6GCE8_9BASI|nr:28S ribosomal protein S5, mitochondrial [Tilletia horrida]